MSMIRLGVLCYYVFWISLFIISFIRGSIKSRNFDNWDPEFIGISLSIVFIFIGIIPLAFHNVLEADYLKSLEAKKVSIELQIDSVPDYAKEAYQKDLDKITIKIDNERKVMTRKEWECYFGELNIEKDQNE